MSCQFSNFKFKLLKTYCCFNGNAIYPYMEIITCCNIKYKFYMVYLFKTVLLRKLSTTKRILYMLINICNYFVNRFSKIWFISFLHAHTLPFVLKILGKWPFVLYSPLTIWSNEYVLEFLFCDFTNVRDYLYILIGTSRLCLGISEVNLKT